MKSNIHKKLTFEDRFDRRYACWVKNNPKAWRWWKQKNRKKYRSFLYTPKQVVDENRYLK